METLTIKDLHELAIIWNEELVEIVDYGEDETIVERTRFDFIIYDDYLYDKIRDRKVSTVESKIDNETGKSYLLIGLASISC